MSTLKVSTISPLGTDATKTITIGSAGDVVAGAGSNTPSFSVQLASAQSLSDNSTTVILFDTTNHDTDSAYDSSTGVFTIPTNKGGKYFFNGHCRLDTTTDASRLAGIIQVNGSSKAQFNNVQRDEDSTGVSLVVDLNAGDAVRFAVFQNTGGAKNTKTGDNVMFMGFKLIG